MTVTSITITHDPSGLFLGASESEMEGVDEEATIEAYDLAVHSMVAAWYPGATVEVRHASSRKASVDVRFSPDDWDDSVEQSALDALGAVWEAGEFWRWTV